MADISTRSPESASGSDHEGTGSASILSEDSTLRCSCGKTKKEDCNTTVSGNSDADSPRVSISTSDSAQSEKVSKCCLKQRLGVFFNCERHSDIHFVLSHNAQKQRIPAHKLILLAGSEVFSAMFSKNWSDECNEVEVPDVEPNAFLALLRFLYTDEVSITADTVVATLYAAKKYGVAMLDKRCIEFLIEILTPENAFPILIQARLFDEQTLIDSCLEAIEFHTEEAVTSDSFTEIDIGTLCFIFERDLLSANEIILFDAVCRWSKAECTRQNLDVTPENQRSVAKGVLALIRFPLLSVEVFASQVACSGLLSEEEIISMFLFFNCDSKPPVKFSSTPRWYKELTVNRFQKVEHGWIYSGDSEAIGFTPDMNIKLFGLGLYGSTSGHTGYEVTIKLIDNFTEESLYENLEVYQSDGATITYKALLDKPVQLQAYTNYTLIVTIWGPDSFCGEEGLKEVTLDLPHDRSVTFVFNAVEPDVTDQQETLRTSVERGQIPELLFGV